MAEFLRTDRDSARVVHPAASRSYPGPAAAREPVHHQGGSLRRLQHVQPRLPGRGLHHDVREVDTSKPPMTWNAYQAGLSAGTVEETGRPIHALSDGSVSQQ